MKTLTEQNKTLEQIYQIAFDNCAGPMQFRHACNFNTYHSAGLRAVSEVAIRRYALAMEALK